MERLSVWGTAIPSRKEVEVERLSVWGTAIPSRKEVEVASEDRLGSRCDVAAVVVVVILSLWCGWFMYAATARIDGQLVHPHSSTAYVVHVYRRTTGPHWQHQERYQALTRPTFDADTPGWWPDQNHGRWSFVSDDGHIVEYVGHRADYAFTVEGVDLHPDVEPE